MVLQWRTGASIPATGSRCQRGGDPTCTGPRPRISTSPRDARSCEATQEASSSGLSRTSLEIDCRSSVQSGPRLAGIRPGTGFQDRAADCAINGLGFVSCQRCKRDCAYCLPRTHSSSGVSRATLCQVLLISTRCPEENQATRRGGTWGGRARSPACRARSHRVSTTKRQSF